MHFSFHFLRHCWLSAAISAFVMLGMPLASYGSIITYNVALSGPNESPANASPGTGSGTVVVDNVAHTMAVNFSFTGLTGNTTASHIHAATAIPLTGTSGVATTTPSFAGFPLGVTAGAMNNTLDMTLASSYNPAFVTANGGTTASAEVVLFQAMVDGKAYLNVHSSTFGGGEIRGFLITAVPEPSSFILAGLAVLGMAVRYRRKRKVVQA